MKAIELFVFVNKGKKTKTYKTKDDVTVTKGNGFVVVVTHAGEFVLPALHTNPHIFTGDVCGWRTHIHLRENNGSIHVNRFKEKYYLT